MKCTATTKKGKKCPNTAIPNERLCRAHKGIEPENRCKAKTHHGRQCRNKAIINGMCNNHYTMKVLRN